MIFSGSDLEEMLQKLEDKQTHPHLLRRLLNKKTKDNQSRFFLIKQSWQ